MAPSHPPGLWIGIDRGVAGAPFSFSFFLFLASPSSSMILRPFNHVERLTVPTRAPTAKDSKTAHCLRRVTASTLCSSPQAGSAEIPFPRGQKKKKKKKSVPPFHEGMSSGRWMACNTGNLVQLHLHESSPSSLETNAMQGPFFSESDLVWPVPPLIPQVLLALSRSPCILSGSEVFSRDSGQQVLSMSGTKAVAA